jgi:hypothetical protein
MLTLSDSDEIFIPAQAVHLQIWVTYNSFLCISKLNIYSCVFFSKRSLYLKFRRFFMAKGFYKRNVWLIQVRVYCNVHLF